MSRAGAVAVLGDAAEWVERCASCRFLVGYDRVGVSWLVCAKWNKREAYSPVNPQWRCDEYEYEPGVAS